MKIKLLNVLKDYENKDLEKDNKAFIVRDAFIIALNSQMPNEVITAEDKSRIYQISIKLFKGSEVDLSLDERSFIKKRADKFLSPLVYGRVCEILEDSTPEPQAKEEKTN